METLAERPHPVKPVVGVCAPRLAYRLDKSAIIVELGDYLDGLAAADPKAQAEASSRLASLGLVVAVGFDAVGEVIP